MIRWITDRLGTAPATSAEIAGDQAIVDVRDLVDKFGNDPSAVRAKIDAGVALLRDGRRVIVCCDYGISRSNSIAAGILATFEGVAFSAAVRRVIEKTGETEIKLEPLDAVRRALKIASAVAATGARPRVMITGGTGFIGNHLRRELASTVDAVVCAGSELDLISGAVALQLAVEENRLDQIVHLANPRIYTSNRALGDSLSMLKNVLDVCRSSGARLVYLSGWEVYSGYESPSLRADESLPFRPKGPYGETKMLCELLIDHQRRMHRLDASIVRSSAVYGAESDKPKFIYNFAGKATRNAPIRTHRYANADPALDLLHVSDLVAMIAMVITDRPQGDFNVGGGRLYSTLEIAKRISDHFSASGGIDQQRIEDNVANILMDSSRAANILGWRPQRDFAASLGELLGNLENDSE